MDPVVSPDQPSLREVRRNKWHSGRRLAGALLISSFLAASLLASAATLISADGITPHDDSWRLIRTVLLFWIFGGLPAGVVSFALAVGAGGTRRVVTAAMCFGAALPFLPAWWLYSWSMPWYLAGVSALAGSVLGAAFFIAAAKLAGAFPASSAHGEQNTSED